MKKMFLKGVRNPWFHIILLWSLLFIIFLKTPFVFHGDGIIYQKFAETLVKEGRVDFNIPGFHGPSFLGALVYLFTESPHAFHFLSLFAAFLNFPLLYLVVRDLLKDRIAGIFAMYLWALAVFEILYAFMGFSIPLMLFFVLLSLFLVFRSSFWRYLAFLPLGFAFISRPYAFGIAPLFLAKKRRWQLLLSLVIPLIYVGWQYLEIGQVQIGVHPELNPSNVFGFSKFFFNSGHFFQLIFSIHNYSPFIVKNLAAGNMFKISPFISFFALFGILFPKRFFKRNMESYRYLLAALLFSSLIIILLPHVDVHYLTIVEMLFIIFALKPILKMKIFIPLVSLSFFYQFFYAYIYYDFLREKYNYSIFYLWAIVFLLSIIYTLCHLTKHENSIGAAKL